jgi:hypothetical protein
MSSIVPNLWLYPIHGSGTGSTEAHVNYWYYWLVFHYIDKHQYATVEQ